MPAPEPRTIWLEEQDGRTVAMFENYFWHNRAGNRLTRVKHILANIARNNWTCPECCDPVPIERRADAVYCREGCRKRAARRRRASL